MKSAGPLNDRDEIIRYLRGLKEAEHRLSTIQSTLCHPLRYHHKGENYKPTTWNVGGGSSWLHKLVFCYNKSVMIYVLDRKQEAKCVRNGILRYLDIWLYRQSFEPYQSQIEFGCHIAATSNVWWKEGRSKPTMEEPELLQSLPSVYLGKGHGPLSTKEEILAAFNQSCILQPTFQSLFIVMDGPCGRPEGPFRPGDIGDLPVHLVNTDCHHPEHKDAYCQIRTTFNVAIKFVRERSTMDSKLPNASLLDGSVDIEEEARKIGWDEAKHGKLPLDRPSSTWVNRNKYTEWTGRGAVRHAGAVCLALRFLKSTRREVPLEDHWWWWERPLPTRRPETRISPQSHL
ncbi:uncharacterized protein FIESC28_01108 [Fusarium coffeatum]|uniref:Uncharacterized protein n=1 Tax=Fusarium coffeatum TaxID=231269 RepID=A0A366SBI3_9HYPO|nr:uncharacterized protein FIESC28_01108 [Fusarium coffeatum]RBR26080.1 hypothetical protein FIESC28_01108 [Fusarium coffeatum]